MDPFARRRLGLTAVEVTQLGFGGAGLGDLFEVIPEAQAAATLEAAWDAGIRYYNTAPRLSCCWAICAHADADFVLCPRADPNPSTSKNRYAWPKQWKSLA